MDLTNRAIIITVALVLIFLAILVIFLTWAAPDRSIERLADFAGYLNDHNTRGAQLVVTFGGLIFILLGAMVLIFEVAPPESGAIRVANVGSGEVRIGTDEIAQRLEEELRTLPQLGDVQVNVISRGAKAEVRLDLYVPSDADIASATDAALRRTREVLEGRMGIALAGPPQARIHYRELRMTRDVPIARSNPSGDARTPFAPPAPVASSTSVSPSSEAAHGTAEKPAEDRPAGA